MRIPYSSGAYGASGEENALLEPLQEAQFRALIQNLVGQSLGSLPIRLRLS